jgi:hypothetical protein
MHPTPTRITLAGSILVLGSLGTMSAVNLTYSPSPLGAIPGAPQAMSPMQVLRPDEGDRPAAPEEAAPSTPPALAQTRSAPDTKPGARLPVSAHDLVGLATGTLEHAVLVPLDDLTRALPVHDVVKALDHVPDHTVRTVDKVITSATGDLEHELGQRAVRDVGRGLGQVLAPRKGTDVPVGNELGAAVARRVGEQVRRTMHSYGVPFHTVSAPTSHTDSGDSNTSYGRHTLVTRGWPAQHNGDQSGSGHKSAGKSDSGGSGRHSASFTSSGGGSHANGSKSSGGSHSGRSKGSGGSHSGGSRGSGGKHRG